MNLDFLKSPAATVNLNDVLIKSPASTFFMQAKDESMTDLGIFINDMLIVDKSLKAVQGNVVVAIFEGEFILRQLSIKDNKVHLLAANKSYPSIAISKNEDLQIWGVVTYVLHSLRPH